MRRNDAIRARLHVFPPDLFVGFSFLFVRSAAHLLARLLGIASSQLAARALRRES
jgi:hypothetical protein